MQVDKTSNGRAAFVLSLLTFLVFVVNLVIAGVLKKPPILSDVAEMLVLFVAVGFFVIGILQREASEPS